MTLKLEELIKTDDKYIRKDKLLSILKSEAALIDIRMIMKATGFLREDARYMQSPYREDYIERFTKAFSNRIKDIKDDKEEYKGNVDVSKLKDFLKVLDIQEKEAKVEDELCFLKIARVVAIYTTFIMEVSIHPVGTSFPGGFKLKLENNKYLCPVKEKQMKNPSALCQFCVSKQDPEAA
ncbi:MAG: DUF2115 domain-containing protein [Methanobacterium sp.]|nr:DUF2115 domain-containing protein [Methanobacterium sp.]